MTVDALRAEWGKAWSVRAPALCLIGASVLVCGTAWTLANDFLLDVRHGSRPPGAAMPPVDAVGPALQVGLLVFAAFVMVIVTSEYATGAIRSTLQAEPRRGRVLAAKTTVGACVAGLTAAGTAGVAALLVRVTLGAHAASGTSPLELAGRAGVLVAVDSVLVIAVAVSVRFSVGALAISFVLLVGLAALPVRVAAFTPAGAGAAFVSGDTSRYPATVGLGIVTGWALATYACGWALLRRRDA